MAHLVVQPNGTHTSSNRDGELIISVIGGATLFDNSGTNLGAIAAGLDIALPLPFGWRITTGAAQLAGIDLTPNPSIV